MRRFLILLTLLCCMAPAMAQEIQGSVDKDTVTVGIQFKLTYVVKGAAPQEVVPGFDKKKLKIVGGPLIRPVTEKHANGDEKYLTVIYVLAAQTPGTISIPAARFVINGKKFKSNALSVTAVKAPEEHDEFDDFLKNLEKAD
ncbi:MAG: BatD family protein [Bacteroidaceae bacterium]|nr:BatD family protein [Candidatus Minthousia equi]MCQ2246243.1 BatD family protein [Bacteroidaceae bacterium]